MIEATTIDKIGHPRPLKDGMRWGDWELQAANLTLQHHGEYRYEVDLEKISSCGEMLDWIFQVQNKMTFSKQAKFDFLEALNEIFHPQATLCSFGLQKKINPTKFLMERLGPEERKP